MIFKGIVFTIIYDSYYTTAFSMGWLSLQRRTWCCGVPDDCFDLYSDEVREVLLTRMGLIGFSWRFAIFLVAEQ